jgi:hypothetical protein
MRLERMTGVVVLAAGLVFGGVALAAPPDTKAAEAKAPADKSSDDVPAPPKGMKAPLQPLKPKPVVLGPQHKVLGGFAGRWKTTTHIMVGTPTIPEQDTEGTAEGKLVMGGRFAQLMHTGLLNGEPFEGMMLCGYDEVVQKYTAIWVDNASTAIIHYVGLYDAAKKQISMNSHYSDPATRRLTLARVTMTFVDANTIVYDQYIAHAVGEKEAHTMSITYKKA